MKLKHLEFILETFKEAARAPGAEHYLPEQHAADVKKVIKLLKKEIKELKETDDGIYVL